MESRMREMFHTMKRRNANRIGHNLRRNCRIVTEDTGKDRSDRRTRKKTEAAIG
jgi:hypothetical protein